MPGLLEMKEPWKRQRRLKTSTSFIVRAGALWRGPQQASWSPLPHTGLGRYRGLVEKYQEVTKEYGYLRKINCG
jgi:hypothetical protein